MEYFGFELFFIWKFPLYRIVTYAVKAIDLWTWKLQTSCCCALSKEHIKDNYLTPYCIAQYGSWAKERSWIALNSSKSTLRFSSLVLPWNTAALRNGKESPEISTEAHALEPSVKRLKRFWYANKKTALNRQNNPPQNRLTVSNQNAPRCSQVPTEQKSQTKGTPEKLESYIWSEALS